MKYSQWKQIRKRLSQQKELELFDSLNHSQKKEHALRLEQTNFSRLRVIGGLALILEIMLILGHDIPSFYHPGYTFEITIAYLLTHLFLLFVSLSALILGHTLYPKSYADMRTWTPWISQLHVMLFLSGISLIAGIDQLTNGQIVSFISLFTFGGFFYYCRPPRQLWVLGTPILIFVLTVRWLQPDPNISNANITNGLLFGISIMVASAFVYHKAYVDMIRAILLEDRNSQLEYLAHHDTLTGLYNRRHFEQELSLQQNELHPHSTYVLGLMDLDYFKKINDLFGHSSADHVLVLVSQYLEEQFKNRGLIARWGGEEFIFWVHGNSYQELLEWFDAVRQGLEDLEIIINYQRVLITGSFGVSRVYNDRLTKMSDVFSEVDQALYHAKNSGRNLLAYIEIDQVQLYKKSTL